MPPGPGCIGGCAPPHPAVQVLWGLPAPTPRGGEVSRSGARYFFHVEKVPKKTPGTPRSPIVYLIGLYQTWDSGATESGFWHLIYSGSIDDASAAALLKRWMFLGVRVEAWFLKCSPGSSRRKQGQLQILRGIPKGGGSPPLCRRGGGVHRGGTPSKGSRPYAAFWLLFVRTKSNPGSGGGAPEKLRKETCFSPTRPATGESKPIGANRWHRAIKPRVWGRRPHFIQEE